MKIILSGGGTLGSVTSLIALYQELVKREPGIEALFVGTRRGPEKALVSSYGLSFRAVTGAKLRRTLDARNFLIPVFLFFGFLESFRILLIFKPKLIVSAGGFVSVPCVWAAWFLGIPVLIHQEDFEIGLANLLMAPFSRAVVTVLGEVAKKFPHPRVRALGNPIREELRAVALKDRASALAHFGFSESKPTLLVLGGGTGAAAINEVVIRGNRALQKHFNILHVTGRGKGEEQVSGDYRSFEFLGKNDLPLAYAASDLALSRAGMGVIAELAYMRIPTVLVPIPKSHQEKNASYFEERGAAYVFDQRKMTPQSLVTELSAIAANKDKMKQVADNLHKIFPSDASERMADLATKLSKKNPP